jgi:cyclase
MINTRVIPCLLLKDRGLVKTERFKNPRYLGDPLNIAKIFNEKEAHELVILDIAATIEGRKPNFTYLSKVAEECFMPLVYGGGITCIEDIKHVLSIGFEKVMVNTSAYKNPELIKRASSIFGSQSIAVSIDAKKNLIGRYEVYINSGTHKIKVAPAELAERVESMGAGEILINSIDRDGTMAGYDIPLIRNITGSVSIPVIACGGAGSLQDFSNAIKLGRASAVAAGSIFVFHGKQRGVLISFPEDKRLREYIY